MARVLVLADAAHLQDGVEAPVLLAEQVTPVHLADLECSQQFLDRLEWAVRDAHKEVTLP